MQAVPVSMNTHTANALGPCMPYGLVTCKLCHVQSIHILKKRYKSILLKSAQHKQRSHINCSNYCKLTSADISMSSSKIKQAPWPAQELATYAPKSHLV